MICANCPEKVLGGPHHSPESVLCLECAVEALELHKQAYVDLLARRAQNTESSFLNID